MGAYNSSAANRGNPSDAYAAASNTHSTRGEMLLSQSGVSHSALVNSGNAAILGHNSFKLPNNANNERVGANGPATLGSTYGALGGTSQLHHQ